MYTYCENKKIKEKYTNEILTFINYSTEIISCACICRTKRARSAKLWKLFHYCKILNALGKGGK